MLPEDVARGSVHSPTDVWARGVAFILLKIVDEALL